MMGYGICKVKWCNREIPKNQFGQPMGNVTHCKLHINRATIASTRPWLYYKAERSAMGKLECEHCGDSLPKKHPNVNIRILEGVMDVDHIKQPTEEDIKNNPWYDPTTGKIEHPDNYQLLCKTCHAIKSHGEGDYIPKNYK